MEKFQSKKYNYPKNNKFDKFVSANRLELPEGLYNALKYLFVPMEKVKVPHMIVNNGEVTIIPKKERKRLIREDKEKRMKQKIVRIAAASVATITLASGIIASIAGITFNIQYTEWMHQQILADGGEEIHLYNGDVNYIPKKGIDPEKYSVQSYKLYLEEQKNKGMGQ